MMNFNIIMRSFPNILHHMFKVCIVAVSATVFLMSGGCKSTSDWRKEADERSEHYLSAAQRVVTGREEKLVIETPGDTLRRRLLLDQNLEVFNEASMGIRDMPDSEYWDGDKRLKPADKVDVGFDTTNVLRIGLSDALKIAAANSREYQAKKESLYMTALGLDLENHAFRTTFSGMLSAAINSSAPDGDRDTGYNNQMKLGSAKKFENGTQVSSSIAVDLAGMLTGERDSAWGLVADASVKIPLLRGSGKLVNMESLTQAQRNLVYAVREFEQYKREFMVGISSDYMGVLLSKRTLMNEEDNYRRVIVSTRRSSRMADAGRLSKSDFDQSHQSELNARNSWISASQSYEGVQESFKMKLGLPPDARLDLSDAALLDLEKEVAQFAKTDMEAYDAGEASVEPELGKPESVDEGALKERVDAAIRVAFDNRPDFRTNIDKLEDAQRKVLVAEDALRAEITIGGSASAGEGAGSGADGNGDFKLNEARLGGLLNIDLPFERRSERDAYRNSLINLEAAVRAYQAEEDSLKESVRRNVRQLREKREQLKIQYTAVSLAEKRVANNDLLLQSGRAEMRDVLDAQAALVSAQNSLFGAIKGYRDNEMQLLKELGLLDVTVDGVWKEEGLDDYGLLQTEPQE